MPRHNLGSLVGAVFGLVFVLVNSGELGPAAATALKVAGVAGFALVVGTVFRDRQTDPNSSRDLGSGFWLLVLAEVVAIAAGLAVLNGPLDASHAGVAWIALVVGLHFLPMARLSGVGLFRPLGAAVVACGIAGLALAALGVGAAAVAAVGGIVPGFLLLAFSWWGAAHPQAPAAQPAPRSMV